jgi:Secretion system C-terminal sorting domain
MIICCVTIGNAQTPCYVKYHYDASGNRIKREFICAPYDDPPNLPDGSLTGNGSQRKASVQLATPESDNFDFVAMPNPAVDFLNMEVPEQVQASIQSVIITDVTGSIVFKEYHFTSRVELTALAAGVYYITLRTVNHMATKKVVVVGK